MNRWQRLAVVLWVGFALTCLSLVRTDWPSWHGPRHDGTVAPGIIADAAHVRLDLEWRRPLGSGCSGIAVRGSVLVTMAADGDADQLLALDATTGAERWRVRLNDRTVGLDAGASHVTAKHWVSILRESYGIDLRALITRSSPSGR